MLTSEGLKPERADKSPAQPAACCLADELSHGQVGPPARAPRVLESVFGASLVQGSGLRFYEGDQGSSRPCRQVHGRRRQ